MKGLKLLTTLLAFSISSVFSQEGNLPKSFKEVFADAEYYYQYGDFREALALYTQAQKTEPANHNINYRIGICLLNIPGQKEKALAYLEYASGKISNNYQEGSYKEEAAPPIIWLYLGDAYRIKGQLDKAINAYSTFKAQLDVKDIYNHDFVDQQIVACEKAKVFHSKPAKTTQDIIDFDFPNLDLAYSPVISEDGSTLFFTQHKKFYEAIYWSKKVDGKWTTPQSLNIPLSLDGEISISSCSDDGNEVFIFVNDHGNGEIYHSTYENKEWLKATKLNNNINSPYWETNASISKDKKTLYFASNRKGGIGGLDIYKSELDTKGEWGPAKNLGSIINTPYNEESPFFCEDKGILFFSSQGHENMGGYDIFFTRVSEEGYSNPINLGYPINTTDDDIFFCPLCGPGIKGVVFKQKKSAKSITQLIEVGLVPQNNLAEISGSVLCQDNADLANVNLKLYAIDKNSGDTIQPKSPGNTTFSFSVSSGNYTLIAQADGYRTVKADFYVPEEVGGATLPYTFFLIPSEVLSGEYLTVRSIQFGFDNSTLSREAQVELEKVYNIMQTYPSLLIEVVGHTDIIGAAAYNITLSEKRAKAAVDFLTTKGIDPSRFATKGVGSAENIAINNNPDGTDNPMGRRFNRRVSIKMLKSDKSIIIAEDISIPENLKAAKDSYFTILLCKQTNQPDTTFFQAMPLFKNQVVKVSKTAAGYIVTVGEFGNKGDAVNLMNQCIDGGYASATIISDISLASLVISNPVAATETSSTPASEPKYTIQIFASKQPMPITEFKGLNGEVKEYKGQDNMYRYVYGEYLDKQEAVQGMKQKVSPFYPDAFVTSISRIK